MQSPSTTNYAVMFPKSGEAAGLSTPGVAGDEPCLRKITCPNMVFPVLTKY